MALPRGLEAPRKINPLANRLDSFVSRLFSWLYRLSVRGERSHWSNRPGRSTTGPLVLLLGFRHIATSEPPRHACRPRFPLLEPDLFWPASVNPHAAALSPCLQCGLPSYSTITPWHGYL